MIIAKPLDGLCNRMRVIKSCVELQQYKRQSENIQILWEKNSSLNCEFEEIFEPIENIKLIKNHIALNHFLNYSHEPSFKRSIQIKALFFKSLFKNYRYFDNKMIDPYKFDINFWINIQQDIILNINTEFFDPNKVDTYKIFKPVYNLQILINREIEKFSKPTIGVHIRRKDHRPSIEKSTIQLFVKCMTELLEKDGNQMFYIATDDLEVELYFRKKFEAHVIAQENKDFSRNNKKGILDAVVDLYTLSKTRSIIGSYGSSFSRTASKINMIPLKIIQ